MENVSEILWVILRSLSRDIENFSPFNLFRDCI
jgi:hypothetical protein